MNHIVFDIETGPLPADKLPPFDESSVAVGNLKDPAKVAAKIEEARASYIANAALSPLAGQVLMVGIKEGEETRIFQGSEDEILESVAYALETAIVVHREIAGFNIINFDLPFLATRARLHGIKVNGRIRFKRFNRFIWSECFTDLRDEWLLGDRAPAKGTSSLEAIARFLGLPPKLGSGADFASLSEAQRIAYLQRDLDITDALYKRIMQ